MNDKTHFYQDHGIGWNIYNIDVLEIRGFGSKVKKLNIVTIIMLK